MDNLYILGEIFSCMDDKRTIQEIKEVIKRHCDERDWDQFHGAKDLAIGIITEASEILEKFRFKSEVEVEEMFLDKEKRIEIGNEMADVLFFLTRLAQKYDINLAESFDRKMGNNRKKYPIDKSKGSNKKYTEL